MCGLARGFGVGSWIPYNWHICRMCSQYPDPGIWYSPHVWVLGGDCGRILARRGRQRARRGSNEAEDANWLALVRRAARGLLGDIPILADST